MLCPGIEPDLSMVMMASIMRFPVVKSRSRMLVKSLVKLGNSSYCLMTLCKISKMRSVLLLMRLFVICCLIVFIGIYFIFQDIDELAVLTKGFLNGF